MDTTIIVAIITASASVIAAALTFIFTKRAERRDVLQLRKLSHYQELLTAISDIAIDNSDNEAGIRFAKSVNTIALIAPQDVITALMTFHDEIKSSNPNKTLKAHDEKLMELLLAIRKSIELPFKDDPKTFNFHLVGAAPKDKKQGNGR